MRFLQSSRRRGLPPPRLQRQSELWGARPEIAASACPAALVTFLVVLSRFLTI